MPDMPDVARHARVARHALATGLNNKDTGQNTLFLASWVNAIAGPRVADGLAGLLSRRLVVISLWSGCLWSLGMSLYIVS